MEIEEIEAVLEKIWDLHDKLSDAIHTISRNHFLESIKAQKKSEKKNPPENRPGYVFVKGFRVDDNDSAIVEAKSLNSIRTALENLEDQLEFFQTVQMQQRAERDTAIAQLEQSRIVLAMRLAEHRGKKYEVIEETLAFVGDVHESSRFISPESLYRAPVSSSDGNFVMRNMGMSNKVMNLVITTFDFAKKSLKLEHMGGIIGNAALVAISMIAVLHFHEVASNKPQLKTQDYNRRKNIHNEASSSKVLLNHLDVLMAQG